MHTDARSISRTRSLAMAIGAFALTASFFAAPAAVAADVADDSADKPQGTAVAESPPSVVTLPADENGDVWTFSADRLSPEEEAALAAPSQGGPVQPLAVPPNSPPASNWAPCGLFDGESKLVKEYTRLRAQPQMTGSVAAIRCGTEGYGYRHILKNHIADWETMAAPTGINWRDMASWSISWNLYDPDKVSYDSGRQTYCYSREVYLYRNGNLTYISTPRTALGTTAQRIITAFPSSAQCPGTNVL